MRWAFFISFLMKNRFVAVWRGVNALASIWNELGGHVKLVVGTQHGKNWPC